MARGISSVSRTKRTSIGSSRNTRPKNKDLRRRSKRTRGQGR